MSKRLYNYKVSIVYKGKKESMLLKAESMDEAKREVKNLVLKSPKWNCGKGGFDIICKRIRILQGGNYEIIVYSRNKKNRK